jgi:hypothetical protein
MIKVRNNQTSLLVLFVVAISVLGLFGALGYWLYPGSQTDFRALQHWPSGWAVVWHFLHYVWGLLLLCSLWFCRYVALYGGPFIAVFIVAMMANQRREVLRNGYEKSIQYQARKLLKTLQLGKDGIYSFGNFERNALLNIVHLAFKAHIKPWDVEKWIITAWVMEKDYIRMDAIRTMELSVAYPDEDQAGPYLPELLSHGYVAKVH